MVKIEEILRFEENPEKSGKRIKIRKNICISHLIGKLSIMSKNIVQIIEIRRFEKSDQKNKKKEIFKLRSFAHEVKRKCEI